MRDRTLLTDVPLGLAAAAAGALALVLALEGDASERPGGREEEAALARVERIDEKPRVRPSGALAWRDLRLGEPLVRGDVVHVPAEAAATLALADGTVVDLAERSLVVIERDATLGTTFELLTGGLRGLAADDPFAVRSPGGVAVVRAGAEVSVRRDGARAPARVTVHAGGAALRAGSDEAEVSAGEMRTLGIEGEIGPTERLDVKLATPARGVRVPAAGAGGTEIAFAWDAPSVPGGWVLELAATADFTEVLHAVPAPAPSAVVGGLAPGVYHWRVRAAGESARSEERLLVVAATVPPVPLRPRAGEIVYLPAGALYTIGWSPVPGAARYRLEIAPERRFDAPAVSRETAAPRLVLEHGLPEGNYGWRVRALFPGGVESPPSRAPVFRLIVKPIPAAPRLLDPELKIYEEDAPAPPAPPPGPPGAPGGRLAPSTEGAGALGAAGDLLWRLLGGGVAHAAAGGPPAPSGKAPAASIVLRWSPVPGITRYRLQIAEDETFARVVIDVTVDATYYEWRKIAKRDYFWRVVSIDPEGRPGEFSPPKRVGAVLSAPALLEPVAGAAFLTGAGPARVRLSWVKAPLARGYEVEIAGAVHAPKEPAFDFTAPGPGEYRWRVRGVDAAGGKTPFGEERTFRVALGAPVAAALPAAAADRVFAASAEPVVLRWSEVSGATEYEVEVGLGKKLWPGVESRRTAARAFSFAPRSAGAYGWRVRALAPGLPPSDWSRPAAFTLRLAPPVVRAPAPGARFASRAEADVEVVWEPVAGATAYEVAVEPAGGGAPVRAGADEPRARVGLAAGHWVARVRAIAPGGLVAEAPAVPFEVVALPALAAPRPLSPPPGGVVPFRGPPPDLTVRWEPVEGAARYEAEVVPGPASGAAAPATSATFRGLVSGALAWRVRAIDPGGVPGPWSEPAAFRFGAAPPAAARFAARVLTADGSDAADVTIRLSDASGAPAAGAALVAEADAGAVIEPPREVAPGRYVLRYRAPAELPPARAARLVVTETESGFRAEGTVALARPAGALSAGVAAGLVTNFGAVTAPTAALVATWRLPVLRGAPAVAARLGWHTATTSVAGALDARATLHAFSAELGLRFVLGRGRLRPYAGAAAAAAAFAAWLTAPGQETFARFRLAGGAAAYAGAELVFRPGALFVEVRYRWLRAADDVFEYDGGGLGADVGWRFSP